MVTFPLSKRLCTFGSVISRHHHPQVIAMKLLVVFIIVTLMAAYCQAQGMAGSSQGRGGNGFNINQILPYLLQAQMQNSQNAFMWAAMS
ncbi:uncharacterized protein LOC124131135 isoform X3 [Haliotis rufescens]|uniref:uncharacterized protein LOC124131135 isoform X3 n=1 Tax=Haliotis rufescens TaxID=6454 RepID=UPI00201F0A3E|nr:uncharacterized protein LOC124131135 isoform X3 [Haliotis rufescens]